VIALIVPLLNASAEVLCFELSKCELQLFLNCDVIRSAPLHPSLGSGRTEKSHAPAVKLRIFMLTIILELTPWFRASVEKFRVTQPVKKLTV
jgi:hypothetical protein